MKKVLYLLVLPFLWASTTAAQTNHCIKNRYSQDTFFSLNQIDTLQNIKYGISNIWPGTGTQDLHMDVYMPKTAIDPLEKRPLIILIHGGAFLSGDKKDMAYFGNAYAQRGFVAVSIQYQLGWDCPNTNFLTICVQCGTKASNLIKAAYRAMQDTRGAIKYLVNNAATYEIDTAAIFLMGESAGSITALQTAFLNQHEVDSICTTCKPTLGSLDTVNAHLDNSFTIKAIVDNCGAINKLSTIDNNNIPVIGFHDDLDCVVPYGNGRVLNCLGCTAFNFVSGSNSIYSRLKSNGICAQMNSKIGSLNHCSYPKAAIVGKSSCFMKDLMCKNCATFANTAINNIPSCDSGYIMSTPEINANELNIYPNPSKGNFTIEWSDKHYANCFVRVMDINGSLIMEKQLEKAETTFNLTETTQGLKFIFLYSCSGELLAIKKIIIQ